MIVLHFLAKSIPFSEPISGILDMALEELGIHRADLPYPAALLAGKAFLEHRQRGGLKRSPLPDFYIGAHAQQDRLKLLTRDPRRYHILSRSGAAPPG